MWIRWQATRVEESALGRVECVRMPILALPYASPAIASPPAAVRHAQRRGLHK